MKTHSLKTHKSPQGNPEPHKLHKFPQRRPEKHKNRPELSVRAKFRGNHSSVRPLTITFADTVS